MRWLVADSLYCLEAFFCSHLDSYSHYLREYGVDAAHWCMNYPVLTMPTEPDWAPDVMFALDGYDAMGRYDFRRPLKRIAQVAAICSQMPWDVRKPDGSPAYDLIVSSIPWMVGKAREMGCRAEYQPLAFDARARACGMGVERDLGCIFIGTTGPNHVCRTQLLAELSDVVTVMPPVFGREYFRTLARAKVVVNVHAEWARGVANAMRLYEAAGMGCEVVSDGELTVDQFWWGPNKFRDAADVRRWIREAWGGTSEREPDVLREHTYENRIPQLVEWVRSL